MFQWAVQLVLTQLLSVNNRKKSEQAGAELCQAQEKLGIANCG